MLSLYLIIKENHQPPSDPVKLASPSFYSSVSLTYSKRTFNESQMPADTDKSSEFFRSKSLGGDIETKSRMAADKARQQQYSAKQSSKRII
jgi:hypothetical protein